MQIFVTEPRVALALACNADWQSMVLEGFSHDAVGCLVAGTNRVEGVVAKLGDRASIDAYFDLFSGRWIDVLIGKSTVQVFLSDDKAAKFFEKDRRIEALVAADVAMMVDHPTRVNTPINRLGLVMRARSYIRAADTAVPVGLRKGYTVSDVEVLDQHLPYAKYFEMTDVTLRHKRFDGANSAVMVRSVLRAADAVTVLPYDPVLDQVVLIEQFRPGAFVRGDPKPWVLEPVAGRCDGDESVEEVAEREMVEEAGLTLLALEFVGNYYPSPGCVSEYLYNFVGLVDLSSAQIGMHGLETENEDIRTHFVSFVDAVGLLNSGEADNGPLIVSLYWLMANRTRLRSASSIA